MLNTNKLLLKKAFFWRGEGGVGEVGGRLIVTPVNPPPESAAVDEIEMGQVPFNLHPHFNFYPSGERSSAYVI